MAITSKDTFDFAYKRAKHYLALYNIVHNSRQRAARSDWLENFKRFMHWPLGDDIVRIDGKDGKSLLILKEELGIDRELFAHDYASELLRSAIVAAISALDRYMHDYVVEKSWSLLNRPENDIPKELKKIKIPVLATKKALEKIRKDHNSRPGSLIKKQIQDVIHREFTFQKKDDIQKGARMLGIEDFWGKVAEKMPDSPSKMDVQSKLTKVAKRRNQIVHESDIFLKISAKKISQREIKYLEAEEYVKWVGHFVSAMDQVFSENC